VVKVALTRSRPAFFALVKFKQEELNRQGRQERQGNTRKYEEVLDGTADGRE
jgi:hypothetical protein